MASGKVREFAIDVLQYLADGTALTTNTGGLYLTLLSAVPAIAEPYTASSISAVEISAGQFRAPIGTDKLTTISTAGGFCQIVNNGGEILFPADAPAALEVSGYALCYTQTGTFEGDYVAYEVFNEVSNASKKRDINQGDTVKVNVGGLTIKEQ